MSKLTRKEKLAAFKANSLDAPVRYGLDAVLYAIRSLITSSDSSEIFYGNLASRLKKRVIDEKHTGRYAGVKTACVALEGSDVFLVVYSPFFDALPPAERIEVIKHELQHIAHRHLFRGTVEKGYDPRIANIAMDAVINQYNALNDLRPNTYIDYANIEGAKPDDSFENYYDLLVDAGEKEEGDNTCPDCGGSGKNSEGGDSSESDSDSGEENESGSGSGGSESGESGEENGEGSGGSGSESGESGEHSCGSGSGSGEGSDDSCSTCGGSGNASGGAGGEDTGYGKLSGDHKFFGESDSGDEAVKDLAEEKLKGFIRKAAESTAKSCGNVSAEVAGILADINEPYKVNWKKALKNWATEAYNREKYYSPFREHKVIKDCYPSTGFKKLPEFAVYIDVSGSVSQEEFNAFLAEVIGINKALKAQVSVSQFDTRVHKTDKVRSASDVPKLTREYAGGTRFDDILRHAKENKTRNIIIMTDGFAPEINTKGFNVLWAYTPHHRKHKGKGIVIED